MDNLGMVLNDYYQEYLLAADMTIVSINRIMLWMLIIIQADRSG